MNLKELLLSPGTRAGADSILTAPPQALLISGPGGSGKTALATAIIAELLGVKQGKLNDYPQFFIVKAPEGKTDIPIEAVRSLISKMSLRVPGEIKPTTINRVATVKRANNLTLEAQNALLKLLEEPPARTMLILTSDSENGLLPTVLSRVQRLRLTAPSLEAAQDYFGANHQAQAVQSAYMLSRGNIGLLSALLDQASDHQLKQAVDKAKLFLAAKPLDRMIQLQKIAKNKDDFSNFLDGLSRTVTVLHYASVSRGTDSKDLLRLRKSVASARDALDQNANTRLVTLALAVGL